MKKTSAPKDARSENFNDTSAEAQRSRILEALREAPGGLTTLECREVYNVLHPAGRIKELRDVGHEILTLWEKQDDSHGRPHRIARYVLRKESQEVAA